MFDRMKERFLIAFYSQLDWVDSLWVLLNLILIAGSGIGVRVLNI